MYQQIAVKVVENVANQNFKDKYVKAKTVSTIAVIKLVDKAGLSLARIDGIRAITNSIEPNERM